MKKIFTFGIFLFLLSGIGSNVSATQFIANTGIKPGAWNSRLTWYPAGTDTTVVANFPLPTYLDDVTIPAGDSIYVLGASYCQSLTVNGTLYTNATFGVNGNITVNAGGTFSLNSNVYCKNIYNYGKFWNIKAGNSSSKLLGVGYSNSGTTATTTASTDSCTILNDGLFGCPKSVAISTTNSNGCGFWILYSNQAKALNITHSNGLATPTIFSACGLIPPTATPSGAAATTAATQNFNLYINESITLAATGTYVTFSLQNGDAFSGTRTCNIASGDTVFVAGYFHTKAGAPGASQGNMTYNVYGCLNMTDANRGKNELDLYTSATSPYVAINVKNGGTLVHGKAINLIKSATTGQTIAINSETNSTTKFGFTAAPVITCTTATVADNTLFPTSYYNLSVNSLGVTPPVALSVAGNLTLAGALNNTVTLNGTAAQTITGGNQTITGLTVNNTLGATLASPLRVRNALTLTSGNVALGSSNLISGSISGGSSSSYVVTSGTGALSTNAATSGTLFPIGTAKGYAPVTITPASNDTISALVSATPTGTFTGYSANLNEWTLTPQIATTAALAFTPTAATYTTSPAIFSGVASGIYTAKTAATVSGTTYSATGISLAASATPFATGGITPSTAVETNTSNSVLVYSANNSLVVKNAKDGDVITVYGLTGSKVVTSVVKGDNTTLALAPGAYIVKVGSTTKKVLVQ